MDDDHEPVSDASLNADLSRAEGVANEPSPRSFRAVDRWFGGAILAATTALTVVLIVGILVHPSLNLVPPLIFCLMGATMYAWRLRNTDRRLIASWRQQLVARMGWSAFLLSLAAAAAADTPSHAINVVFWTLCAALCAGRAAITFRHLKRCDPWSISKKRLATRLFKT